MSALLQGRVCIHEGGQRRSGRALLLQDGRRHPPDRLHRPGHHSSAQRRRRSLQVQAVASRDWNSLCCFSFPQDNPSWAEYQTKIPMPAGSSPPYTVVMTFDSTTSIVSIAPPRRVFSDYWFDFRGTATATAARYPAQAQGVSWSTPAPSRWRCSTSRTRPRAGRTSSRTW